MIKVAEFIENELLKQTPELTFEHYNGREESFQVDMDSAEVDISSKGGLEIKCTGRGTLASGKELEVNGDFYLDGNTIYLEDEYFDIEVK